MEINANSFQGKKINNDNSKPIKIVLDVMGSDFDSLYAIEGARIFLKKHKDVQITLCGNKENILSYIKPKDDFLILEANNIIHTHDSFPSMLRNKESSMYKSFEGVSLGKYDGMVSAGTTSAFVLLSNTIIKTLPQITKPAFMSYVPKDNGSAFMFLDVGANLECDASNLHQFAKLGNIYAKTINKVDEPKIYILNIGTEENKGFLFQQEAHKILLQDKSLNYCGFIESRYLLSSDADVVVCDGYTGNVALKALEGSLLSINKVLKQEFKKP
jgi:glycerol-3-phosphate acyltransferase PlsX